MRMGMPQRKQHRRSLSEYIAAALAVTCVAQAVLLVQERSSCVIGVTDLYWRGHQVEDRSQGGTGQVDEHHRALTLADLRGAPLVFITFGNTTSGDFVSNWALSLQRLGLPFLVGALDAGIAGMCKAQGWAHLDVRALIEGSTSMVRDDSKTIHNMGATKVQVVLTLLEEYNVQTVVATNSDVVWLGDLSAYLASNPTVDFFLLTDCLSHKVEVQWKRWYGQPRCGHVPGNAWGRAFNPGMFVVRNRQPGRTLLERWRDSLMDPSGITVVTHNNVTLGTDNDQLALNILLNNAIPEGPVNVRPEDDHVLLLIWAANNSLRINLLPVIYFPSGHVAFVQRLPWRASINPLMVHDTFQRYPVAMQRSGKRGRFREFGMWFVDDSDYYARPEARYLTYANDVRRVVDEVVIGPRFKGIMPVLHRHLVAVAYQLAQFRDALAAARMLNRTLVLPTSWCWCDYNWTPDVLQKCKIRGSDLVLPFECPADFVLHIPFMEQYRVDFRMPGYLDLPQVPWAVRRGQAEVPMMSTAPSLPASQRAMLPGSGGPSGVLWPRMTQGQLLAALQPLNETVVLTIQGMRPGLLQGFDSPDQQVAFDSLYENITRELYWCCASQSTDADMNVFHYTLPQPYGAGYRPWGAPLMSLPPYCDLLDAKNKEFTNYENHPCSFLRNATAAAMASAMTR